MAVRPSFFAELKRRHVWRVIIAYAVAAWLLIQIATQVFPFFNIPNWAVRLVVLLLVIGFPIVVALAWAYEITPEGIRRTESADSPDVRPEGEHRQIGRRLNALIVAVLIAAVALMGWRLLVLRQASDAAQRSVPVASATTGPAPTTKAAPAQAREAIIATPAVFHPPAGTIVVLPFANLGGDPKQQYFSDGITEELTNALGQNTGLRVIAWDTASKFRDSKQSATDIGKALDVASVLTGKIERQGDNVRVIVELVNAANGYQLWSNHYDDQLANIFQVQDKISGAIAAALKVKFADAGAPRRVNPQAYDLVLKARALMDRAHTAAPVEQARTLLEQAIGLDPDYAEAHAALARVWLDLTYYSTLPLKDGLPKARAEAHRALTLDPDSVTAIIALAVADRAEGKRAEARAGFQRAIELDPSNAYAHLDYANVLPMQQYLAQTLEAVQLDPGNAPAQNDLAVASLDLGEYAQALPPLQALLRLDPHSADSAFLLALTYALLHQNAEAAKAFDLAQPETPLAEALIAAGRLAYASVLDPARHAEALAAVAALGRRTDLDPVSLADVIQLDLVLGEKRSALARLPGLCASASVICSDLSVNPIFLPLRGDPGFEALVKQYDTVSKPAASAASSP
jgi:TolB-like protein/Tfp pilus assembly protein PilF